MPKAKPSPAQPNRPRLLERFKLFGLALGRSCYDMEFYRQVRTGHWTKALAYYLRMMSVLTIIIAGFLGPTIHGGLKSAREFLSAKIPEGASISLSGGQLSAALPMPMNLGQGQERFIVDTSRTGLDFPREEIGDNGVLVGRDAVFIRSEGLEERTYSLKQFPTFSVNKRMVISWLDRYIVTASIGLSVLLAVAFFLAESIGYLLLAMLGALLTMLLARLWKVSLSFSQWLSVALHAVTLPLVLSAVFDAIGWQRVPVFSIVFFMIMASVVTDERAASTQPPAPAAAKAGPPPPDSSGDSSGPMVPPAEGD